ncbi:MAG: zf-HC2 domain-containing protein [Candidatus Acidiferrales bacterium]
MSSRERDDAMAGLLKRTLAGDAGAGDDCPGPDILAAYFERSLDADETAHVELHLSECARCREQLAALGRAEEAAATQVADTPRRQPRASWLWDWRWLAPVAAVLILTAVWATRRPEFTRIAEQPTPKSAEVTPSQPALQAPPRDKQLSQPSLIAPAPSAVPTPTKAAPAAISREAKSQIRVDSQIAGSPPPPKPAASSGNAVSAENLPFSARDLVAPNTLSKKTVAPQKSSTERTANAASPSANESVEIESAAPAVAPPQAAPQSGAPMMAGAGRGNGAGVAGGVAAGAIALDSAKAKQQRIATNGRQDQAEILTATQEQLSASFVVRPPDKSVLWRIGNAGFIERSGDAGLTWSGTLPKQNAHYAAGSAPSAKVCWLVGNDGIILLTQDAANWQTIPPPTQTNFVAVAARDAWTATVTTADGRKFTTTNQGESWTPAK